MQSRLLVVLALVLGLLPVGAVTAAQPAPGKGAGATVTVLLTTSMGELRIAVESERAPVSARNFLQYVDEGRLDGATFYRALNYAKDGSQGLVQGGLRGKLGRALPPIRHESTVLTGLTHLDGAVSMARDGPGGFARSEFFIVVGDMRYFDASPDGSDPGYAVFGRVVSGMSLVRRMQRLPRAKDAKNPQMEGQMLAEPVTIVSARRMP